MWFADRKTRRIAVLPDEDKERIENFTPESSLPYMKCGHATELASVLKHPEETVFTGRAYDETFSKTMRKLWVQFAKTGNPSLSADISPDGKVHEWPLYDRENREVMVFDSSTSIQKRNP